MEKNSQSLFSSLKNLSYDITDASLSFIYSTASSYFKPFTKEDFKSNKITGINILPKTDVNSFGPLEENIDISKLKPFNLDPNKVIHTKKIIDEFNRRRSRGERRNSFSSNQHLDFIQMENLSPFYQFEEHKVLTKDGFILTLFRINTTSEYDNTELTVIDDYFGTNSSIHLKNKSFKLTKNHQLIKSNSQKQAIVIQHGVVDSSDGFLCHKEDKCLPLILAKAGYDVWLSNSRGNYYSEEHLIYDFNKNAKEYYDYSFDEMGRYDFPSIISKIQEVRKNKDKLIIIAHSQGTAAAFAGMSMNNSFFSERVKLYIALAPVIKLSGLSSTILRIAANSGIEKLLNIGQYYSVLHRSDTLSYLSSKHLNNFNYKYDIKFDSKPKNEISIWKKIRGFFNIKEKISIRFGIDLSSYVFSFFTDGNSQEINDSNSLNRLLTHVPSGSSVKCFTHFKDNRLCDIFRRPDYGRKKNQNVYGTAEPPEYKIEDITVPTVLLYGEKDKLTNEDDVDYLHSRMIKTIIAVKRYKNLGHISFQIGKDISWITDVIGHIKEYEKK